MEIGLALITGWMIGNLLHKMFLWIVPSANLHARSSMTNRVPVVVSGKRTQRRSAEYAQAITHASGEEYFLAGAEYALPAAVIKCARQPTDPGNCPGSIYVCGLLAGGADTVPENWPLDEMRAMMREHLDLALEEATSQLNGNYAASIVAYDRVHEQALEMGDMLSRGIIKQFPNKFKGGG